jgi:hypothetical protein
MVGAKQIRDWIYGGIALTGGLIFIWGGITGEIPPSELLDLFEIVVDALEKLTDEQASMIYPYLGI